MKASLGSRPWAGIDIGAYSIKLLALQPGVGGARYWASEVPLVPTEPGLAAAPPDPLPRALSTAFELAGLSPRAVRGITVGVSGPDVIVKQIPLPLMEESEVAGALRFEARKHLPFDPSTLVLDFQLLGRYPGEKKIEVLLAAVSQQRLDRTLAPFRALGIEPTIVDAAPLALTNALSRGVAHEGEARLLVDIGLTGSWLTLYQRGAPYFARRLDWGGASVTAAVADALTVPVEEAEEWKLEAGSDSPSIRIQPDAPEVMAVRASVAVLAEEIRRSFAFYRTLGKLPDPLTLWVSGSTARLPGLAGQLSEGLGVPVLRFDPFESLGTAVGAVPGGPQFAQAYGLALRAA